MTSACWASFWPKKATSGATMLSSFVDDGRDAVEVAGAARGALERLA